MKKGTNLNLQPNNFSLIGFKMEVPLKFEMVHVYIFQIFYVIPTIVELAVQTNYCRTVQVVLTARARAPAK